MPPLSLYLHLPWCVRKCPYCDFNSFTAHGEPPKARYVKALVADIECESEKACGRVLDSVFLGGGTPSFFTPSEIDSILSAVQAGFALAADAEITMEANPGTVECGDPAGYRSAGVNRLSLGAQSFDDGMLARLGRMHSAADIYRAFDAAREAGFDNINIDLMHTLPDQDADAACADLQAALSLQPEHLSWYQLTLEPNTVFFTRPPPGLPDDDTSAEIQTRGQVVLHEHAYAQYEISAYAKDQRRCRHNLNYWQFGDYLACGAGAHGKHTDQVPKRYVRPANPEAYMQSIESGTRPEMLDIEPHDRLFEFLLMALRLNQGFTSELYAERTGRPASELLEALREPVIEGLIEQGPAGHFRPTSLGFRFLNDLQARFLPDSMT